MLNFDALLFPKHVQECRSPQFAVLYGELVGDVPLSQVQSTTTCSVRPYDQ